MLCLIGILSIGAGCSTTSPTYHNVGFDGEMHIQNDTFRMQGEVDIGIGAESHQTYHNISVVLYDEHQQPIKLVPVGTLTTKADNENLGTDVNITSERIPKYVIIQSPDFWASGENLVVEGYWRDDDDVYEVYGRDAPDQTFQHA